MLLYRWLHLERYLVEFSCWRRCEKVGAPDELLCVVAIGCLGGCHVGLGLPQRDSDSLVGGFIGQQQQPFEAPLCLAAGITFS